jgi:signal transduction histidine kinase
MIVFIESLLKELSFWAGVFAIWTAKLAYVANPQRSLNRQFALFSIGIAAWQFCLLASHFDFDAGFWLCASSSCSALLILLTALCLDSILHPVSSIRDRFRRKLPFAVVSLILASARWLPWWNPMSVASPQAATLFFFGYYTALLCALAVLAIRSLQHLKTAPPATYLELRNFTGWCFTSVLVGGLMVLSHVAWQAAESLSSALLFANYVWTVYTMTSHRIFGVRDAVRSSGQQIATGVLQFTLTLVAVVAVTVFSDSGEESAWKLALVFTIIAYLAAKIADRTVAAVFSKHVDQTERSLRKLSLKLMEGVWSEPTIINHFRKLLAGYLRVTDVTVVVLDAPGMAVLSTARRRLVDAALKRGWVTPESAGRAFAGSHLADIRESFRREGLAGMVVHSSQNFRVAFFIGHGHGGPTVVHWHEIQFCQELAQICSTGIERLRSAGKAMHANRLAIVGFMASQFRHEARNRMESIIAALELLAEGQEAALTDEHRQLLLKEARSFSDDQEMALAMARPDAGDAPIGPMRVGAMLQNLLSGFSHIATQAGVKVKFQAPALDLCALGNEKLLRQVVLNLLRNSVQALESTPAPAITITMTTDDDVLQLEIRDNGPGVNPVIHDQLFQPFATSKKGGTGIGLSICTDAMGMMNGGIRYLTPRGQPNAVFQITLPLVVADTSTGTLQLATADA